MPLYKIFLLMPFCRAAWLTCWVFRIILEVWRILEQLICGIAERSDFYDVHCGRLMVAKYTMCTFASFQFVISLLLQERVQVLLCTRLLVLQALVLAVHGTTLPAGILLSSALLRLTGSDYWFIARNIFYRLYIVHAGHFACQCVFSSHTPQKRVVST